MWVLFLTGGPSLTLATADVGDDPAAPTGEAILAAIRDHAAGRSQFDDITLVCFGRNAQP